MSSPQEEKPRSSYELEPWEDNNIKKVEEGSFRVSSLEGWSRELIQESVEPLTVLVVYNLGQQFNWCFFPPTGGPAKSGRVSLPDFVTWMSSLEIPGFNSNDHFHNEKIGRLESAKAEAEKAFLQWQQEQK